MKLCRLMMLATAIAAGSSSALATDLHFDYVPLNNQDQPGANPHFGVAQFNVLNYPSIDGNYMAVTGTLTATQIAQAGNTAVIWYDSFNHNEYGTYSAADEATKINNYATKQNGYVRPGWVVLNELSSLMRDTTSNGDAYRQWATDVVSLLHNTYNYNVVVLNQKGTLKSSQDGPYQSTWQSLASNAYIGIEEYLGGPSIINSGSDYTSRFNFAKNLYQNSKNSYINVGGISADRLVLTEHFGNTSGTNVWYGRHDLMPASDWDAAIQVRQDAIYSVGFAGFLAYAWGNNAMGITEAEQIQHEYYYRTRLVLPGQQPQWLPDDAYTIGDAATPVPLSWNQPLNWLGNGVVDGMPNSVPNSPGAVANFFRTNTAARTITLDGDKTIGMLTFNSPNSYTISPGSGGSILLNNSGSPAIVTVSQGTHSVAVPVQLQDNANVTIENIADKLTISGAVSGAGAITKAGSGTFVLSGANSYLGGTTVSGGTLLVNNTNGSGTGSGAVTVNSGGALGGTGAISGAVTINSGGHIAPGASTESLDVGSLSLAAGSILDFQLDTIQGVDTSDLINVTTAGGLAISGGTLNLTNAGSMTDGFYTLIDYSSSFTGSLSNISLGSVPAGFSYRLFNDASNQSIDLEVTAPGDLNHDGTVNGDDYVILRKGLGTKYSLTDYETWRAHFGQSYIPGAGATLDIAVPEPATIMLSISGTLVMCFRRRRAAVA